MCKARRNLYIRKDLIEKAEKNAFDNGLDFNGYISYLIANDGKQQFLSFPQIEAPIVPLSMAKEEETPSYTEEDMDELDAMLDM